MIYYKVFNQLTGQYQTENNLADAENLRNTFIDNYLQSQNILQKITTTNFLEEEKATAAEFLAIKLGIVDVSYLYTNYNATTKQELSHVFLAIDNLKKYLIKVTDNIVTEWYESDREVNGDVRTWVSLDVNTDEPIEYYIAQEDRSNFKYDLNNNFIVSTHPCSGLSGIPEDKLYLLNDFKYKENICCYSEKEYGFIVEFTKPNTKDFTEASEQEITLFEIEKQQWILDNKHLFPINKAEQDEHGNETWTETL